MAEESLGDRIARLRMATKVSGKRMTQDQLAEKVGVTKRAVGAWERGERTPQSHEDLAALAKALNTNVEYLLRGDADSEGGSPEEYSGDHPAEQLLDLLRVRAGLRRLAGELTDKDLIAVAYTIAREDHWSIDDLRRIDRLRDLILAGPKK